MTKFLDEHHANAVGAQVWLGEAYVNQGDLKQVLKMAEEALEKGLRVHGEEKQLAQWKKTMTYKYFSSSFFISLGLVVLVGLGSNVCMADQTYKVYWPTKEWKISTPEEQNMASGKLVQMNKFIDKEAPDVRSILISREGYIVFEKYYKGDKNHDNRLFSVTKSIVSTLVGICLDQGKIKNVDQKMYKSFPEYESRITDPRTKSITVKHLLTMTPGFSEPPGFIQQGFSSVITGIKHLFTSAPTPSFMEKSFSQAIVYEPGEKPIYSDSTSHLLSGIITNVSGTNTRDFAEKYLFAPLGIQISKWEKDEKGYYFGGSGLYMKTRDMAKLGYLFLKNGVWGNRQIVSKKWVEESIRGHVSSPAPDLEATYGYQWWIIHTNGVTSFLAIGYGGQNIQVTPELGLVIVITSDERALETHHENVAERFILPSVRS